MVRAEKGKSLIAWPDHYVVVDIETTGLRPYSDHIIEIGAIKVVNQQEVDRFSQLINPGIRISHFISQLTGITNEMLVDARNEQAVLADFMEFVGDEVIVGHNVNFDINFLYDAMEQQFHQPLRNDFIDTMRISRMVLRELPHHRLGDLAAYYGVDYEGAHRAVRDCEITNACFIGLHKDAQ